MEKKSNKFFLIGIVVLLLAIIAIILVLFVFPKNNNVEGSDHYNVGDIVYFDPVSDKTCNEDTYVGNDTCYQWCVIETEDKKENDTITIQMNHNLVNYSAWSPEKNVSGPVIALETLNNETETWSRVSNLTYKYDSTNNESNYGILSCVDGACTINDTVIPGTAKARMITGEEVKEITNTQVTDDSANSKKWTLDSKAMGNYYVSNSKYVLGTKKQGEGNNTNFSWLVENTIKSDESGATANAYGEDNFGYWTLSPVSNHDDLVWRIGSYGCFDTTPVNLNMYIGIRPVITISKSNIK